LAPLVPPNDLTMAVPAARHLYVHVPFCARRCSYCDFAIAVRRTIPVEEYVSAVMAELRTRLQTAKLGALSTIYLGGGTPSKLGSDGIARLLDAIRSLDGIDVDSDAEVTIEANPEDVTREGATAWRLAGVNRLSLGTQTFDARALAWMHRTHDAGAAGRAFEGAREGGFTDISMDLIFALPDSLDRSWPNDLSRVVALQPEHLSLYGLTVESGTPLGKWTARGEALEAPEERYASEFLLAHETLASAGYEHYEVSNFARPGRRSRHNGSYWRRVPYVGVGPSAHSFDGSVRRWNQREFEAWRQRAARGEDPMGGAEELTPDNVLAEEMYLGLRTTDGLDLGREDGPTVQAWVASGWATLVRRRVSLTAEGWLRLDSLAAALTAARSR